MIGMHQRRSGRVHPTFCACRPPAHGRCLVKERRGTMVSRSGLRSSAKKHSMFHRIPARSRRVTFAALVLLACSWAVPAQAAGVWIGGGHESEAVSAHGYSKPDVSCGLQFQSWRDGNSIFWGGSFWCDQILGTILAETTVDETQ